MVCEACGVDQEWCLEQRDLLNKYAYVRQWQLDNPDRYTALLAKYRAKTKDALPPDFDLEATIPFYAEAHRLTKETGVWYQVDHVIPIAQGGLHEPENLDVIPALANLRKGDD